MKMNINYNQGEKSILVMIGNCVISLNILHLLKS